MSSIAGLPCWWWYCGKETLSGSVDKKTWTGRKSLRNYWRVKLRTRFVLGPPSFPPCIPPYAGWRLLLSLRHGKCFAVADGRAWNASESNTRLGATCSVLAPMRFFDSFLSTPSNHLYRCCCPRRRLLMSRFSVFYTHPIRTSSSRAICSATGFPETLTWLCL